MRRGGSEGVGAGSGEGGRGSHFQNTKCEHGAPDDTPRFSVPIPQLDAHYVNDEAGIEGSEMHFDQRDLQALFDEQIEKLTSDGAAKSEQLQKELEALKAKAQARDEEIEELKAAKNEEAKTTADQLQLQKDLDKQKRVAQTRYDELRIIKDANHVLQNELKDLRAANGIPEIETPMTETSERELGNGNAVIEPQTDALKLLGLELEHQKRESDSLRNTVTELQDLAKTNEFRKYWCILRV